MRSVDVLKLSYSYVRLTIFFNCVYSVIKESVHVRNEDMRKSLWHDIFDFNACKDPCRYVTVWLDLMLYILCSMFQKLLLSCAHSHAHYECMEQKFHLFLKIYFKRGYLTRYFISTFIRWLSTSCLLNDDTQFLESGKIKDFHIQKSLVLKMKRMKIGFL